MDISFAPAALFELAFYVLVLVFVIHAAILSYHWLAFGADRQSSLLGISVYLLVGAFWIGSLAISLTFI